MVYLYAAVAQFCVVLLTQMAVLAGCIVASGALLVSLAAVGATTVHALIAHRMMQRPPPSSS